MVAFTLLLVCLVQTTIQKVTESISINNLVRGDLLTLAPFTRIPNLNYSNIFFPQQKENGASVWPLTKPVFRTKLTPNSSEAIESLMGYIDSPEYRSDSYMANAYTWARNKTLQRWDISGDLAVAPNLTLVAWAELDSLRCRQLFVVPIQLNTHKTKSELVYCLQKDHLLKMQGVPLGGDNPIFYDSIFKPSNLDSLLMKPTFRYLRNDEGNVSLAYNFLVVPSTSKIISNNQILFVKPDIDGKLQETVTELEKSNFVDGALPSNIVDLFIQVGEISDGLYIAQLIASLDEDTYAVYLCGFRPKSMILESCTLSLKLKRIHEYIDMKLISQKESSSSKREYIYQYITEDSNDIYSTDASCIAEFHKDSKIIFTCEAGSTKIHDIAKAANIDKLWVLSTHQGVKSYYRNKDCDPQNLLFSEVMLQGGKNQFIYGNESSTLAPARNGLIIGINTEGYISFYSPNCTMLLVDTGAIKSVSNQSSETKVFFYDTTKNEFDYFWLNLDYLAGEFQLSNFDSNFYIFTQEKTRLRFTIDQIKGPLHSMTAEKDGGSLGHAPKMRFLEELEHFTVDRKYNNKIMQLPYTKHSFGTLANHIDLKAKIIRHCRPFASNFSSNCEHVMCSGGKNITLPNIEYDNIENVNFGYGKMIVVYSAKMDARTDKTNICYILINMKLGTVINECFGTIYESNITTQIVMSHNFAYIFSCNNDMLEGMYFEGYTKMKLIPEIASGVKLNSYSIRRFGSTDQLPEGVKSTPHIELNIIRAGMVNTILYVGESQVYNKHSNAAIGTDSANEFVCSTGSSQVVGNDFGLFVIKENGEILPLTPNARDRVELQITSVMCLEGGSILVQRGEDSGFNIIPSTKNIEENRGHRQTIYEFSEKKKISFHNSFLSGDYQYLIEKGTNKIFRLSMSSRPWFVQSKTKSKGQINFDIVEAMNHTNKKSFDAWYISQHNSYFQNYSNVVQSKPAKVDGSHYLDVEYFPVSTGQEGHFWKFESYAEPNPTKLTIVNRFNPLNIELVKKTDTVSHIQAEGMEIFYAEGRFLFYKEYSHFLLGEFNFDTHYVTKLMDVIRSTTNPEEYSILARVDSISKRGLVKLTFTRDANNRFRFVNEQRLNFILDVEDRLIRVTKTVDDWYISVLKQSYNSTLFVLKYGTGEIIFTRPLVDKFDVIFPRANSSAEGDNIYIVFSVYGSETAYQTRIELKSRSVSERRLDIKLSMGEYCMIKCAQKPDDMNKASCVFAGISLHWVDLELNSINHLKMTSSVRYEAYKNMEVKEVIMRVDEQPSKNYFLIQFQRINEDIESSHDAYGLLYYSARGENCLKFGYGGLTNYDLLDQCMEFRSIPQLTSNQTLILTTCEGVRFFSIENPRLYMDNAWKNDLDKGLNVTVYGVSVKPLDFDKKTIHRLYKFTTLLGVIAASVLVSSLAMIWVLCQKKKISLDYEEAPVSNTYDKESEDRESVQEPSLAGSQVFSQRDDPTLPA